MSEDGLSTHGLSTHYNLKGSNVWQAIWEILKQMSKIRDMIIWEHIWEKGPIGYVLQYFWSSRDSSTLCFNILRYLVLLQSYV